ncbi:MAG: hypothetical protein ACYDCK_01485 [Thermoplasmatota archaeon]
MPASYEAEPCAHCGGKVPVGAPVACRYHVRAGEGNASIDWTNTE